MLLRTCFLSLGFCVLTTSALAGDYRQGDVSVDHPWSRPTPPGTPVGVGYMTIRNHGEEPVTLVEGATPTADRVSIHETVNDGGTMKMRPLPSGLTIPAGDAVELKPHSYHLMLESLEGPLEAGEEIPLTLKFEGMDPFEVRLKVQHMDDAPETDHRSH